MTGRKQNASATKEKPYKDVARPVSAKDRIRLNGPTAQEKTVVKKKEQDAGTRVTGSGTGCAQSGRGEP